MTETATVAIDPHVHSEGSYDSREPVELILEYVREIDLDGVVVTDHDAIENHFARPNSLRSTAYSGFQALRSRHRTAIC